VPSQNPSFRPDPFPFVARAPLLEDPRASLSPDSSATKRLSKEELPETYSLCREDPFKTLLSPIRSPPLSERAFVVPPLSLFPKRKRKGPYTPREKVLFFPEAFLTPISKVRVGHHEKIYSFPSSSPPQNKKNRPLLSLRFYVPHLPLFILLIDSAVPPSTDRPLDQVVCVTFLAFPPPRGGIFLFGSYTPSPILSLALLRNTHRSGAGPFVTKVTSQPPRASYKASLDWGQRGPTLPLPHPLLWPRS